MCSSDLFRLLQQLHLVYKNGSSYKQGVVAAANGSANEGMVIGSIIFMNGSTDYVELYGFIAASSGGVFTANIDETWFNGCFLRSA